MEDFIENTFPILTLLFYIEFNGDWMLKKINCGNNNRETLKDFKQYVNW